ncbi:LpxI family protein [uncultured Megasphaera sp.]|uniref:LpxI family protein n=1 Tax=uncultured Megasphaera sp. TaxID=165188 RepID=UPI0025D5ADAD|nr:UDP-2,3-diacylglucosamine diphosphatase LpxI [uncultured Megasphaera sp.]
MEKVGLLAGIGKLPVEFMRAAKHLGYEVVVIAVVSDVEPELAAEADTYYEINVAKLDKIIKTLKKNDVSKVTMIGKVTKEILFKGLKFPDWRAIKLLAKLHNRKDDTIMLAIVDELAKDGLEVVDQTLYLKDLMPDMGVLSRRKPTEEEEDDIRFGFVTAKAMGGMDIGQTVVVKHKAVMAVEAIEGTDACIRRGGALGREKSVVVKVAKPNQDPRFDVPAVGRQTVLSMIESNCNVLAMEAGRTLFVEQDEVLRLADSHGIVICAVDKNF